MRVWEFPPVHLPRKKKLVRVKANLPVPINRAEFGPI